MAEYGLKIKNANGFLMVDGTYSNLALRSNGSFDMSNADQMVNGAYFKSFQVAGQNPVIALAGSTLALVLNSSLVGGVLTVVIVAPTRTNIPYYVFDNADLGSKFSTNYGLIVKNINTGQVVFDSRCRYMRILDIITSNNSNWTQVTRNYSGLAGAVAVVQSSRWRYGTTVVLPGTPPKLQPFASCSASKVDGVTVTLDSVILWTYAPDANNPFFEDSNTMYTYLVLDITNF